MKLIAKLPSIEEHFKGSISDITKNIAKSVYQVLSLKELFSENDWVSFVEDDEDLEEYLSLLLVSIICDNWDVKTELDEEIVTESDYSIEEFSNLCSITDDELKRKVIIAISDYYSGYIALSSESSKQLFEQYYSLLRYFLCWFSYLRISKGLSTQFDSAKILEKAVGVDHRDKILRIFSRPAEDDEEHYKGMLADDIFDFLLDLSDKEGLLLIAEAKRRDLFNGNNET